MLILGKIDISSLLRAFEQFQGALPQAHSDLEKAGAIQYFEFTFELAWKTMRRILAEQGKVLNSPKTVIREAGLEGLIQDPELWIGFVKDRNDTVHSYNHDVAESIFEGLPQFHRAMIDFIQRIQKIQ